MQRKLTARMWHNWRISHHLLLLDLAREAGEEHAHKGLEIAANNILRRWKMMGVSKCMHGW